MTTTFMLGAGFALAANARRPEGTPSYVKGYPLAADLRSCFDHTYSFEEGIEAAFAEADARRDQRPGAALVERLLEADHYLGAPIAQRPDSHYRRFAQAHPNASFLTFNYDALLEFSLLAQGRWIPTDGFGVAAEATMPSYYHGPPCPSMSAQTVLHLHGSLYLYPREFDIKVPADGGLRMISIPEVPGFCFDPDANTIHFMPFEKGTQDERYKLPDQRIIAPVPDKAPQLAQDYVRLIYRAATRVASTTTCLVAIGYSFASTDATSYCPILNALPAGAAVRLISRDATATGVRLGSIFPGLRFSALATSFEAWSSTGFGLPDVVAG